jgi:hypothetical protein
MSHASHGDTSHKPENPEPAEFTMQTSFNTPMLELFHGGAREYQPTGSLSGREVNLAKESGDPEVSLENVQRLLAAGLVIQKILVRPTGVLIIFSTGEQYYAPGLRVGGDSLATRALVEIAVEAEYGSRDQLMAFYRCLPRDFEGPLPDRKPDALLPPLSE